MNKWISKNDYLTNPEILHNAKIAATAFTMYGMSPNAIYATLGNMQAESGINPGIWENLESFNGGYGLVQWTPFTKYANWWGMGWENNGDAQIKRIVYELENDLQWSISDEYPMTFKEYWKSDKSPEYLAYVFLYNYERPADLEQPKRAEYAKEWSEKLKGLLNPNYLVMGSNRWPWSSITNNHM